jgi:acetyl-CoA C-acetyltransferase
MAARLRWAIRWARRGTKLMSTLLHALKARGGKYGLQTMCEGGGVANVTIVEMC